jgi:hypothetical protein
MSAIKAPKHTRVPPGIQGVAHRLEECDDLVSVNQLGDRINQILGTLRHEHRLCSSITIGTACPTTKSPTSWNIAGQTARQFAHRARGKLKEGLRSYWKGDVL